MERSTGQSSEISIMAANYLIKYGIIGVGMMGREHLINLHHLRTEGVAVVAIADPHVPSQKLALDLAHSYNWPLQVSSTNLIITLSFV